MTERGKFFFDNDAVLWFIILFLLLFWRDGYGVGY